MDSIPEIDIHEAKQLLDAGSAKFIDVRDPASFQAAHIEGAEHVNDHNLTQFLDAADREQTTVVYCYHGNASLGGAAYFLREGFSQVYSMRGGFEAWRTVYRGVSDSDQGSS